jgi:uncharacterized protein (TIGR03435 family)
MYRTGIRKSFFRACCAVCAIAMSPIGTGLRAGAQTPSTDLSFEVATVKPILMDASHPFNPRHFGAHVSPAGASYWSMTIEDLIDYAYGVEPDQVTGPEWANADRFDIEARFPDGADKKDDRRMLQALLKDRFKLAVHIEKRELEINALIVGKHGEKLRPSLPDPAESETDSPLKGGDSNVGDGPAKSSLTKNPDGSSTLDMGKKKGTQTITFDQEKRSLHWELSKMTMEELAGRLSICLGIGFHKVVDETGIKGNYQVAFDCPQPGPPRSSDPDDGSLLTRSLDALGLKLEKRKVLMDVYVIDHVDRPSAN